MESPSKKRKINSHHNSEDFLKENLLPKTSTPQKYSQEAAEKFPSFSGIFSSSSSLESEILTGISGTVNPLPTVPTARKSLQYTENIATEAESSSDFLEETRSNLTDITLDVEVDDDNLNYQEFFKKSGKIRHKGLFWDLYKPSREDDISSLYYRIINDPKGAQDIAKWFICHCIQKSVESSILMLHRFFFDCAGYQVFNVEECNGNFNVMLRTLLSKTYTNTVFKSHKFLLGDSSKKAQILKYGIYYFLQEFILQAHETDVLYGQIFKKFIRLLVAMRKNMCRPLLYSTYIFVMKLLTGICMVKEKVVNISLEGNRTRILDAYIFDLYVVFKRGCHLSDKNFALLKIESLKELKLFIHYSAKIFIDHFDCLDILKELIIDEVVSVRSQSLDFIRNVIENKRAVDYLKTTSIKQLSEYVWGRVSDVKMEIALKAIEVFTLMVSMFGTQTIESKLGKIIEIIYHEDFRAGSAAAKCLLETFKLDNRDEKFVLLSLCKLAKSFFPNLKALVVESFIEHTRILQNWPLIMEIFTDKNFETFPIEFRLVLSELFLESAHLTIEGKSTKKRAFQKEISVLFANNQILAHETYINLKMIIMIYFKKSEELIGNIFKVLLKIEPTNIDKQTTEIIIDILQIFNKMLEIWTDPAILEPFLDYLLYVNEHFPKIDCEDVIKLLRKNVTANLYRALTTKDKQLVLMAKKTSLVFSKFDLSSHIEWRKLMSEWNILPDDPEVCFSYQLFCERYNNLQYETLMSVLFPIFLQCVESIFKCCLWALIWKLRKIDTKQGKPNLDKDIFEFLSTCNEALTLENDLVRFKVFEVICEFSINFSKELEEIIKHERALEFLKLTFSKDLKTEMVNVLTAAVEPKTEAEVLRFRKYITYICQLVFAEILSMDFLSNIFVFYDKYYEHYGKLLETILLKIQQHNENWIATLVLNAISILYQRVLKKHGVVDYRSQDGKMLFSLSKRFHEFKKIINPRMAGHLLIFAVNYVSQNHFYDFLIYITNFTQDISDGQSIIDFTKQKVPENAKEETGLKYFLQQLQKYGYDATKKATPKPKTSEVPRQDQSPKTRRQGLTSFSSSDNVSA